MTSPKEWWRRAAAAAKDKRSICLTKIATVRRHHQGSQRAEVTVAVIRATSHDQQSVDHKSVGRVLAWARAAPSSLLDPLMWTLAHRAARTRSWAVALKSLLLAHGLLLCSDDAPLAHRLGRLPFDLSDFRGRSSSAGFAAFIRAYFRFLDHRSLLSAHKKLLQVGDFATASEAAKSGGEEDGTDEPDADLAVLEHLQTLLDLLMQVRPYADGMEVKLVLEAMDCVMIEIFEVYSSICNGIAQFLADALRQDSSKPRPDQQSEATKIRGITGVRILRRAANQSSQLSGYLELCRSLGVFKASELPVVQSIPEEDIADIERLLVAGAPEDCGRRSEWKEEGHSRTVVTNRWVLFEDNDEGRFGKEEGVFVETRPLPPAGLVAGNFVGPRARSCTVGEQQFDRLDLTYTPFIFY